MNSFYASVECMLNPSLKGKPVAVGGSAESRHGIILAKSQEAKRCGVKTGEALWEARQKCRDLIIIEPHFDEYMKYSDMAHEIYRRYTDLIEPFGLDECWLDISASTPDFSSGEQIAQEIRETVKFELGLTVSIGVSFNKIFAKLGSDIKKPDAVTCIGKDTFKEQIWTLPASDLLGVGRSTTKKLGNYGIFTIGQLAKTDLAFLRRVFGKCGEQLWTYANGLDTSRVKPDGYSRIVKSVGHGITCVADLVNADEVWKVFLQLSQDISRRLKEQKLSAMGVQISVKDNQLISRQFQMILPLATQSAIELAKAAIELFNSNYRWNFDVRAVTVRAINLQEADLPSQLDLFNDWSKHDKQEKIDNAVMDIRRRFGKQAIFNCCLMQENKIPHHKPEISVMPAPMFK